MRTSDEYLHQQTKPYMQMKQICVTQWCNAARIDYDWILKRKLSMFTVEADHWPLKNGVVILTS